jgi:hypothetical protein
MLALYDHIQMLHEELGNCLSRRERKTIKAELKAALDELAKLEQHCDEALFGGKPNAE